MRIAVIFGNDGSDPRIIRTCRTLLKLGHEVHFIGWDRRTEGTTHPDLRGVHIHVLRHATLHGHSTFWAQFQFTLHIIRQLWSIRPDTVCAANEENALRVMPFRYLLYRRLVCDVIDSPRDVFSARSLPIRLLTSLIAEIGRVGSDCLIATDRLRFENFGRHQHKTKVIGNFPEDPTEPLWSRWPTGQIKLYVAGTLSESRGLRQLLSATEQLDGVSIVAAGIPCDKFANDTFIRHPKVSFRGFLQLEQSLELASSCDAVFAFYTPNCRNNILASPTKLYESMSVGRPVIINAEAKVSQWVVENSLGFSCPFDDTQRLRDIIQSLVDIRADLPQSAEHSHRMFCDAYSWEKMEGILEEIYGRASAHSRNATLQKAA